MKQSVVRLSTLIWGILLAAWLILIFALSSQSYEQQTILPLLITRIGYHDLVRLLPDITITYRWTTIHAHTSPYLFVEFLFRKGAHLFVYATFAGLLFMFIRSLFPRRVLAAVFVTLLVATAVPALDEWNQLSSANRTGNATDVVLDFAGGCVGLLVCLVVLGLMRLWKTRGRKGGGLPSE
ncbi:VanZ family protein [Paenibacillus arenilitoris]|uniref:VanZ family protein n=1 Tax=Paenibacillus arenilitoris TaxID=2772299 RepID=A0A927H876_9BACL|nr:VanZ family protein [Paenibacillus arenilitoris]MBD2872431.1 VanZ family protein [Paenibacillus arenilitoris]